jgi:ubiquinone/menaquinone biosynthesis C-methylase UbiE
LRAVPDVRERWQTGRLHAVVYDAVVEREPLAGVLGRLVWGTDAGRMYRELDRVGDEPDGSAILDIPCGGGLAFRGLRPGQAVRYVAADLSPVMLARAREEAARRGLDQIEFVESDVEALAFEDATFDLCLTYNSLHCFPDPAAGLREMARVLRPGARLRGTSVVTGTGMRQDAFIAFNQRAGTFGRVGRLEELRAWLDDAGLVDVEAERSGALALFKGRRASAAA